MTFPATTNQACCACSKFNGISNKYLFYFLISHKKEFIRQGGGGAQPNISKEIIINTPIPIPPVKEQERIVNAIDKWFNLISQVERTEHDLQICLDSCKAKVLDLAIHGKLVPQDPSDEPAIELLKRINPAFKPSDNLHYEEFLPTGWVCATYEMLNQHRNRSITPPDSPQDTFELYSVPIYDAGKPEYLTGKEIGSSKQVVEKGDVLLCKINPHLNRAWVVKHYKPEFKCIASSEWLIFKSDGLYPEYTRLFFMSPAFRSLMLSNVSGVGGSLMRARGSSVNGYSIWVPPIEEQKRIVAAVESIFSFLSDIEKSCTIEK